MLERPTTAVCLFALAGSVAACGVLPAQDADLGAAERELRTMFERPAGTPISDEQKQRLAAFVERWRGRDLKHLGYARAMNEYLERRYEESVGELDRFFDRHEKIDDAEHAKIAGRIYVMALYRESQASERDVAKLKIHAERMARLYDDLGLLERTVPRVLERLPERDARAVRLAVARGLLDSAVDAAEQERFLKSLFGGDSGDDDAAGPRTVPATQLRPAGPQRDPEAVARARAEREQADRQRASLTGRAAPALDVKHVVGGAEDFSLAALRGKVVVLDFTATWCAPCRAIVPQMIELQKQHGDALQVVGVTRYYRRGVDFSDGDPTRGTSVRDLDEAAEIRVNEAFVETFEIIYPVVIVGEDTARSKFGVTGIPTVFVVGKDGAVVGHAVGSGEASHQKLLEMVERALQ